MGRRRQARELALQTLYLVDLTTLDPEEAFRASLPARTPLDEASTGFARDLAFGTVERRDKLDAYIQKHARNWELARMACVDRNLLRLASFEMLARPDTPVSVVINEALELAKRFSSEDSSRFLNGILDKIKTYREEDGSHVDEDKVLE